MRNAIRSASKLRAHLGIGTGESMAAAGLTGDEDYDFPVFVPLEFASRMVVGDANDPLLRQVMPVQAEGDIAPGYGRDPVGDSLAQVAPGLLHKYSGRALVVTTGVCGVHCRYCFRRQFPYASAHGGASRHDEAIKHLRADTSIEEVLLSGGDPLTLSDEVLRKLIGELESIPHLRRLRIHSRMPIVIPSRVTTGFVELLSGSRLTAWMVVHVNHPNEIDASTSAALARMVDAGIPVLNQAVLLRGINDNIDVLEALCGKLIDNRVIPYYLHQLDRVTGAAHFEVDVAKGQSLCKELEARLPGYAVPRFVQEQAGEASKTRL